MGKKLRDYIRGGLAGAVLAGAALTFSGCDSKNIAHEIFRYDEKRNDAPIAEAVEIDYSKYDKEKNYQLIEDRAYLKKDVTPNPTLEKIVDVPSPEVFRIPALGDTKFIEDPNGELILQYRSRLPASDLQKVISPYLKNVKIESYSNQNVLIFSGPKKAFAFDNPNNPKRFNYLTTLLNQFDLPAMQIRVKLSIVEYFNDNTYDRDLALSILKNNMNVINLNLPSSPDPTAKLLTGINLNLFYNQSSDNYTVDNAIKFLDSYGKARVLSDIDVLAANGRDVNFLNTTSIPYPELLEGKIGFIETMKYRETGTTIKMTPFANDQGFITIKLEKAESGEHTGYYGTFQRPTFRTADLKSEFTVRNGITYYIGTSLFTRDKSVKRGIPAINLIPFLGDLFSSRSIEKSQAQLLYFVEARIVERESDVGTQVRKIEKIVPAWVEELVEQGASEKVEEEPSLLLK